MIEQIQALIKANPIILGGAGMAIVGWLMMQAKTVPAKLLRLIQDQFSTTMTVYSEDSLFRRLDLWLAQHPSAKHSRRFAVAQWTNRQSDQEDFSLTPGAGFHLLREGWRFYLAHRNVEEKTTQEDFSKTRRQTVNITTLGRSAAPLNALLCRIKEVSEDRTTIPIYLWSGHDYYRLDRRLKRPMDTVYADKFIKQAIIDDITKFLANRAWYAERGIPYRRGFLLEGPPGTGKTTFIFALASLFDKPVYIINPASIDNDNQLQRAVNAAGSNFVVIEDIDSLPAAEARETKSKEPTVTGEASAAGITLSGLLNAFDGIGARDGRLLFITSNHPDVLDAALIRPGRIDKRVHLGHSGTEEAVEMFRKFFPEGDAALFVQQMQSSLPMAPADLQNRLLGMAEV